MLKAGEWRIEISYQHTPKLTDIPSAIWDAPARLFSGISVPTVCPKPGETFRLNGR
jgi:hypothetical protein